MESLARVGLGIEDEESIWKLDSTLRETARDQCNKRGNLAFDLGGHLSLC